MAWTLSAKWIFDANAMRNLQYVKFWFAGGIILTGVVTYLTLAPSNLNIGISSDKAAHFLTFTGLMVWFCGIFRLRRALFVAIALLAFGVLIELLQGFLSYRTAELADAGADAIGVLFGWGLAAAGLDNWAATIESWLPEGSL